MTMPKPKPKTQNRIPMVSSLCPSIPKKVTCVRSGSFRLASPPTSVDGWARAAEALRNRPVSKIAKVLPNRSPGKESLEKAERIKSSKSEKNVEGRHSGSRFWAGELFRAPHGQQRRMSHAGFPHTLPGRNDKDCSAWPHRIYSRQHRLQRETSTR